MAVSPLGSAIYAGLFPTGDTARPFTDSAEVRAMLLVEGALARVQGELGVIPSDSAAAIGRAAMEVQIVSLLVALRAAMEMPPSWMWPAIVTTSPARFDVQSHCVSE